MPIDMTSMFNTVLTPDEEAKFQAWARANPRLGSVFDYDARGFWKAGGITAANGHGSDLFKKPNHPTFSDQSQYHGAEGKYFGGSWIPNGQGGFTFAPSPTNRAMMSAPELNQYFQRIEPNSNVVSQLPAMGGASEGMDLMKELFGIQ